MAEFRAVIWPSWIVCGRHLLDEAYLWFNRVIESCDDLLSQVGLKAEEILQITDVQLQEIAEYFNMTPHEGFLGV